MTSAFRAGLLSCCLLAACSPGFAAWVSAYYAGYLWNWTGADPAAAVNAVDMTTMTHFLFAWYVPGAGTLGGSAGQLIPGAGTGHTAVEDLLIAKAHAAGVKALMMIGGEGQGAGWVASTDSAHRAAFINNILDQAVAKNYDGADVDWEESLETALRQNQLITFIQQLRSAAANRTRYQAPNAPFIITLPHFWVNPNTDLPLPSWKVTVASLVDQFNIMTYSMNGTYQGWQSWFWAALKGAGSAYPSSVESSLQAYVDAGVPRSKLGIGVGLYGDGYSPPVTGMRQPISGGMWGGNDPAYHWADFYQQGMLSGPGVTYTWDAAAQTGFYSYAPAKNYRGNSVSVLVTEDLQSVAAKGAWVKAGNAGGTIVWTINFGYVNSTVGNPPMNAIKQAFLQNPNPAGRCDLNQDQTTTVTDIQLAVNQAIGVTTCSTGDINGDVTCNVIDVQRVVNAALGGPCISQ